MAWVCVLSLHGDAGSMATVGMDVSLSLVNVVCCQVKFSVTGRSFVQRGPTECVCFIDQCAV